MNLNNFTIKGRDTLNQASQIAAAKGQQAIETGHVLKALQEIADNITGFLLKVNEIKKTIEFIDPHRIITVENQEAVQRLVKYTADYKSFFFTCSLTKNVFELKIKHKFSIVETANQGKS